MNHGRAIMLRRTARDAVTRTKGVSGDELYSALKRAWQRLPHHVRGRLRADQLVVVASAAMWREELEGGKSRMVRRSVSSAADQIVKVLKP